MSGNPSVTPPQSAPISTDAPQSVFDQLPGDLMMWVLIVSELLVFGAGLVAFLAVRITDAEGFATAQDHLHRSLAGLNTLVLVTSGYFAARASAAAQLHSRHRARQFLALAMAMGAAFLVIKLWEYSSLFAVGITFESHAFFTFYALLTGFHAAHVAAGLVLFAVIAWRPHPRPTEAVAAFWHMVDLVWVLLFPVIYLLR